MSDRHPQPFLETLDAVREPPLTPMFQVALIETRNTCTRTCSFCKFGQERQDAGLQIIEDEIIEKIARELGELGYAGRLSPFGINEPLIEPRIFDIIKLLRQNCPEALLTIASNGDCLTHKAYDRLFESGLDYLLVDAYDERGFQKASEFAKRGKVSIKDMRLPDWGKLENRGGSIAGDDLRSEQRKARNCLRPSTMLFIRPPGHVVLCCSDMYSDVIMGDLRENSIAEIWQNEKFQHYRHTLETEGRSPLKLCQNCSFSGNPAKRSWSTPELQNARNKKRQSSKQVRLEYFPQASE